MPQRIFFDLYTYLYSMAYLYFLSLFDKDESELWIPRKACNIGLQFSLRNIPHIPPRLITELLRKLNKVS